MGQQQAQPRLAEADEAVRGLAQGKLRGAAVHATVQPHGRVHAHRHARILAQVHRVRDAAQLHEQARDAHCSDTHKRLRATAARARRRRYSEDDASVARDDREVTRDGADVAALSSPAGGSRAAARLPTEPSTAAPGGRARAQPPHVPHGRVPRDGRVTMHSGARAKRRFAAKSPLDAKQAFWRPRHECDFFAFMLAAAVPRVCRRAMMAVMPSAVGASMAAQVIVRRRTLLVLRPHVVALRLLLAATIPTPWSASARLLSASPPARVAGTELPPAAPAGSASSRRAATRAAARTATLAADAAGVARSAAPGATPSPASQDDGAEAARYAVLSQNWERTRLGWMATGDAEAGLRGAADLSSFAAAVQAAKKTRKRRVVRVNSKSILNVRVGDGDEWARGVQMGDAETVSSGVSDVESRWDRALFGTKARGSLHFCGCGRLPVAPARCALPAVPFMRR